MAPRSSLSDERTRSPLAPTNERALDPERIERAPGPAAKTCAVGV